MNIILFGETSTVAAPAFVRFAFAMLAVLCTARMAPGEELARAAALPDSPLDQPLLHELSLKNSESNTNRLELSALPANREAVLALKARVQFDVPGGFTPALQVRVNGQVVDASRLVNKPRFGKAQDGRIHSLAAGESFSTCYAPDFVSADTSQYGIAGVKLAEFELRITDMLRAGENELTIANTAPESVTQPMIVADVRLEIRAVDADVAAQAGPPTGPLPLFSPAAQHRVNYRLRELPDARLEVDVGSERYSVASEFSTPDSAWVHRSNSYFRHQRTVQQRDEAIVIRDTFSNLTTRKLPLMQRHSARAERGALKQVWLAGISPAGLSGSSTAPDNPTTFGATEKSGLGLLPLNDEFLVHSANSAEEGVLGLADQQFVLQPGATYTAEWAIVPVERPVYFDFVNAARRLRDANFTIRDCFAFLRASEPVQKWTDAEFVNFARRKSATLLCASIDAPLYEGVYPHGTAFQLIDRGDFKSWVQRVERLLPGVKSCIYFHCFIDVVGDGPSRFADARVLRSDGSQADYGLPHDKIYFPTTTNAYGRAVGKNVDLILDEIGADGVYWDEIEYSAYRYHYGEPWDGCSADIDTLTHQIARLKSSIALLSQPWRAAMVEKIMARGPLIGNGQPHTRTMARFKFPRFVETGSPSNCAAAQLFSPIALGDHLTERSGEDAYHMMLTALDFGCLYHWYNDMTVIPAYPTLTEHMYPFTPVELHEGFVIGEERILTKRSGRFGWGDRSKHEIHAYDEHGRELAGFKAPIVEHDGALYTEVRLAENWSAAIVRHRHDGVPGQ